MDKLFQISGYIHSAKSQRNGAWRFEIDSQELIDAEMIKRFVDLKDKLGWFTFASRELGFEDIKDLPKLDPDDSEKKPSERLRAVLFVYYDQQGGKGDFNGWYRKKMEKYIQEIKEKLE